MVQPGDSQKVPGLAVEGGEEAVVMGSECGHGDLSGITQRFGILIIGVELILGVILLCIVEHHVFLDFQHIGEALGALFDLTGDQRLHIDGAAILQLFDFRKILLGIGLFTLGPYAGIYGDKLSSSHSHFNPFLKDVSYSEHGLLYTNI